MRYIIAISMLFLLAGCTDDSSTMVDTQPVNTLTQTGVVAEMIEVENYTFIRLESDGSEAWIATLPVWVSKGDVVEFSGGAVMKDFYSETLNRTFSTILFVQEVQIVNAEEKISAAHKSLEEGTKGASPLPAVSASDVVPLEGGMTVTGIFSSYPQLDGQTISLRARVIKFSPNIMGLNWVTMQDGSGTMPIDKLVATTEETIAPGDLVTVTGTIRNDVSLGHGYDYKVLLEEARFEQENDD